MYRGRVPDSDRLWNLLGALGTGIDDLIDAATAEVVGLGAGAPAALLHLERTGGCGAGALQGVLGLSQPGTAHVVRRLVDAGLVTRERGIDRRAVHLLLSDAGADRAAAARRARHEILRDVVGAMSVADRNALERGLGAALEVLGSTSGPPMRICRLCDVACCERDAECPVASAAA